MAVLAASAAWCQAPFDYRFDPSQNLWQLDNGVVVAVFQLSGAGQFQMKSAGLMNSVAWTAPPNQSCSPISFALDGQVFDASTQYSLIEQHTLTTSRGGYRQVIVLGDSKNRAKVELNIDLFPSQQVIRFRTIVTNITGDNSLVTASDMMPLVFADPGSAVNSFRVDQWTVAPKILDFQSSQTLLKPGAVPVAVQSGAHGSQVSWVALRDAKNHGLFAGWEFNGRSAAWVAQAASRSIQFSAPVDSINHPLAPGQSYYGPAAFIGFFQGDWDEAGYRTQRFVESSLARPAPDLQRFPYMSWDSWGYQEQFDETTLMRNARIAASLGVELFIVDLGWASQIGDWHSDPAKFPHGMKAVSDYVHALGMKFGVHLTPAEASPNSPVMIDNPDWASSENDNYYNSVSLCLSHAPARTWAVSEIVRVIDDYGVDWILQDGENMVKNCTKTTHTHNPADSNFSNSTEGIDYVVEEVLRQRPNVSWENCENGGNMMTFKMVQDYVTSITNDASGALGSRQGVFGATYPFSARFADRYSPEDPVNTYNTRSYMFGGPWHLMNRLDAMSPEGLAFAQSEIAAYKAMRGIIQTGKIYHLTAAPAAGRIDAVQGMVLGASGVVVVTRESAAASSYLLKPRGMNNAATYRVHFRTDPRVLIMTGLQLSNDGVAVVLPDPRSAEIVYLDRQP